ncbi:hypothetical protein Pint_20458 [Pistacia integerrima]|uniref:Uncharacterized protein n=1 Tax=Pistacia integerrima TaxID=434235 RepID=A0ACC0XAB6_9ROSI|nr:hypothetical protein Pint_20458 [Pistacia integerrima]
MYSTSSCSKCGYNRDRDSGIVKTCLDCFLNGEKLYIFEYGMPCKSPDEVIKTTMEFLQGKQDFGKYNFVSHNCEDFASYCKTGLHLCSQRESFVGTVREISEHLRGPGPPLGSLLLFPNFNRIRR